MPSSAPPQEMLTGKRVKVYEADTRDYEAMMGVFAKEKATGKPIHSVVHLAGLKAVGESVAKPHSEFAAYAPPLLHPWQNMQQCPL